MKVLIVGAGVAGPTLAYWLLRSGHQPTLVERAPALRNGGYVLDFWGAGFDVAEKMGIVPRLFEEGYVVSEMREVSQSGRPIARLDPQRLFGGAAGGRFVSIPRSRLARAIYDSLDGAVETIFGDTVESLSDEDAGVTVKFASGAERDYDLVIGADGLHSRVRQLVFGPEEDYERYLGIVVAVFDVVGYEPRDELMAVTHTAVGMQALRFALRDGSTMICLTFRHDGELPLDDTDAQMRLVRERLSGEGWEVPAMLAGMERARTFFIDRVSQIRMPMWSKGRVALVGDAAASPSLLAGQGSALAMIESYVLAAALHEAGEDHEEAFGNYEHRLRRFVEMKQDAATGMGAAFAPRNGFQVWTRNTLIRLMGVPVVARLALGRSFLDPIELPPPPVA